MKKNLILLSIISLSSVLFQFCQKSGNIDFGDFPKQWFFLGIEGEERSLSFYMLCDDEVPNLEIKRLDNSYQLLFTGEGRPSTPYEIRSFKLNDDNTGVLVLADQYREDHLLSFEYLPEDDVDFDYFTSFQGQIPIVTKWFLDEQFIGRAINDNNPNNINRIYPPCLECFPFDECLGSMVDPTGYIEMINYGIDNSIEGMVPKEYTETDMDGFSGTTYMVHYLKGEPVKVTRAFSAGAYSTEKEVYYVRNGDLVKSSYYANTRPMMDDVEMTEESSNIYFHDGVPVDVEEKYMEYMPEPGEAVDWEKSLPGFEELAFQPINFNRESLSEILEFKWKNIVGHVEGFGSFEGTFVELSERDEDTYYLQIRNPLDEIQFIVVTQIDNWIGELKSRSEFRAGKKVLISWKFLTEEIEDDIPTTHKAYRNAVWIDNIMNTFTEPNHIKGALMDYNEMEFERVEIIEGEWHQLHPSCGRGGWMGIYPANEEYPAIYIREFDVYHCEITELMVMINKRIRIKYYQKFSEEFIMQGWIEIKPYDDGELIIDQTYFNDNTKMDPVVYYLNRLQYEQLPVAPSDCG
jgi:hypothetical protein